MEFTDKKYHVDKDDNYIDHSPDFRSKHNRDGFVYHVVLLINWNKPQQKSRRDMFKY